MKDKGVSRVMVFWAIIIGLLVGLFFGQIIGDKYHDKFGHEEEMDHSKHDDDSHEHSAHVHEEFDASSYQNPPEIGLNVYQDKKSGWNIYLNTVNFEFSPEAASGDHVDGQGHAHLYINREKVGRLYGNWHHIDKLDPGMNEIMVTLNTNDHKDYTVNGEVVMSVTQVEVVE